MDVVPAQGARTRGVEEEVVVKRKTKSKFGRVVGLSGPAGRAQSRGPPGLANPCLGVQTYVVDAGLLPLQCSPQAQPKPTQPSAPFTTFVTTPNPAMFGLVLLPTIHLSDWPAHRPSLAPTQTWTPPLPSCKHVRGPPGRASFSRPPSLLPTHTVSVPFSPSMRSRLDVDLDQDRKRKRDSPLAPPPAAWPDRQSARHSRMPTWQYPISISKTRHSRVLSLNGPAPADPRRLRALHHSLFEPLATPMRN